MKINRITKGVLGILLLLCMNIILTMYSIRSGSIDVSWSQLIKGLFVEYDEAVAIIYNLRLPRIIVALLAGGALSVSGLLLQSALKNPLADPGIIGISGGSSLAAGIITTFFPQLFFSVPIISFIGGAAAYMLIYILSWKKNMSGVRIILFGIAVAAVFSGLDDVMSGMSNSSGVSVSMSGLTQLTWKNVYLLMIYSAIGFIGAIILAPLCNIMSLSDETVHGLGINVNKARFYIAAAAVMLSAGVTATVGVVSFLALISPHISRRIIGNDNRILVPFTMLLGAFILLGADTAGRLLFSPYEVSAAIIMNILGGPFFIFLLHREGKNNGT